MSFCYLWVVLIWILVLCGWFMIFVMCLVWMLSMGSVIGKFIIVSWLRCWSVLGCWWCVVVLLVIICIVSLMWVSFEVLLLVICWFLLFLLICLMCCWFGCLCCCMSLFIFGLVVVGFLMWCLIICVVKRLFVMVLWVSFLCYWLFLVSCGWWLCKIWVFVWLSLCSDFMLVGLLLFVVYWIWVLLIR